MRVVKKAYGIAIDDAAAKMGIRFDKVDGTFENGPSRVHNRITELHNDERQMFSAPHCVVMALPRHWAFDH